MGNNSLWWNFYDPIRQNDGQQIYGSKKSNATATKLPPNMDYSTLFKIILLDKNMFWILERSTSIIAQ